MQNRTFPLKMSGLNTDSELAYRARTGDGAIAGRDSRFEEVVSSKGAGGRQGAGMLSRQRTTASARQLFDGFNASNLQSDQCLYQVFPVPIRVMAEVSDAPALTEL